MIDETPWSFREAIHEDEIDFHWRMIFVAVLLAFVTVLSQWRQPAPYGRFDPKNGSWGPQVNQRISHVLNDGLWGVLYFSLYWDLQFKVNLIFVVAWLTHFTQRGFIHPFIMRYSSRTVPLGIPITGLTLAFFAYLHGKFFSMAVYRDDYINDFRFTFGFAIFLIGFFINRASDFKLRSFRSTSGDRKYYFPQGVLFKWVSCPNYLGELFQWFGWAIATWAPCGCVYFLFTAATFIPRARHTHLWYQDSFKNYPTGRKALIPLIF